ncbi:MAG: YggU family protein [Planctomycetes bacterium]|nr:YggU family protein [Planctomycetota bacterium]
MPIQITDHAEGCIVNVRAQPGARRNAVVGEQAGALKVAVTAPPDKGRANDAIVEVLAEALGLKRSQVEIVSGHTSRQKRFLLRGLTAEALRAKLQSLLKI